MRYSASEFDIYKISLMRTYDLELDDPSLPFDIYDSAMTELRYRETIEDYEQCAFIRDFIVWYEEQW